MSPRTHEYNNFISKTNHNVKNTYLDKQRSISEVETIEADSKYNINQPPPLLSSVNKLYQKQQKDGTFQLNPQNFKILETVNILINNQPKPAFILKIKKKERGLLLYVHKPFEKYSNFYSYADVYRTSKQVPSIPKDSLHQTFFK
eukprot:UN30961